MFRNYRHQYFTIFNAGSFGKLLIVDHLKEDHNERDFIHLIIVGIMDLLKKSSKTREASCKWSTILSIMDLLKIFSEVIVASKRDPLARIEKQAIS